MQYIIGKWEYMILNQKEKNDFSLSFVILTQHRLHVHVYSQSQKFSILYEFQ